VFIKGLSSLALAEQTSLILELCCAAKHLKMNKTGINTEHFNILPALSTTQSVDSRSVVGGPFSVK
jgi:hypothetical protein